MKNKLVDILFILYRLFFMFVSVYVISRFTVLGDYDRYASAQLLQSIQNFIKYRSDTALTDSLISLLRTLFLGRMLFVNIFLNIISSMMLLRLIRSMKYEFVFLVLFLSPSFTIWSSFASKEIIIVTVMAFMFTEIIHFLKDEKVHYILGFLCAFIIMFYKLQLVLPVIQLILSIWLVKKYSRHSGVVIVPLILFVNILGIFIMRDYVDDLVRGIIIHFSQSSRSTRDGAFLMQNYGFFLKLPYGMFISFFGPTISEMSTSYLHLFTAVESTLIIGTLLYLFLIRKKQVIKPDFIHIMVLINLILLLMFFQTPWGILNPGSAIRYRADYYIYILLVIYFYREDFFVLNNVDDENGDELD